MGSANERRRYIVTSSLTGRTHARNDLWVNNGAGVEMVTCVDISEKYLIIIYIQWVVNGPRCLVAIYEATIL